MIKNYFFLKHIINNHNKVFKTSKINSIFTQTKNEIIFDTTRGFLLINFDKQCPYIVYKDEFTRKSQSMSLAKELINEEIESIKFLNDKRIIELKTSHYTTIINLYYSETGMSIYDSSSNQVTSFKSPQILYSMETLTNTHLYSLLHHEIAFRKCTEESFITLLTNSTDFYFYRTEKQVHLSNIELHHLSVDPETMLPNGIYEGYNRYIFSIVSQKKTTQLKRELTEVLNKHENMYKKTLEKLEKATKNQKKKEELELSGHLIMGNIHSIKTRQEQLVTNDWNTGQEVSIKLNPELNAHQNAEYYYRKAKGFEKNQKQVTVRQAHISKKLEKVHNLQHDLQDANYYKKLEKIKKQCVTEQWIKPQSNKEVRMMQSKSFNYYEFQIDGHDVFVGKDAKSNDYLSLKYSKANDYWFHVQGSPGSHVILKWHGYKEDPSKDLLKKVASLTAYYSKMKNAGNIPVIYTQSKYVKKPRGAKPGAVIVQKEKSIFIQPKPIEELI